MCDCEMLCNTAAHTLAERIDLWTWMHAAYGGVLFFLLSPLLKWTNHPNSFYLWLFAVIILAIIWDLIGRHKKPQGLPQHVHRCACFCCCKCFQCNKLRPHELNENTSSVSDIIAMCLAYSLSWNIWLLQDILGIEYTQGLLIASPMFCVFMAIVQAVFLSRCYM